MERVEITRFMMGICHMQVCAVHDATDEEILDEANKQNPSGTTNGWVQVVREDHENEDLHPVVCEEDMDRRHFILIC